MLDILIIGILVVSGIIAISRGFIREALGILSWVIAFFAALYGYPYFSPLFEDFIENKVITEIIAGISIAIVVLIVCTLIMGAINKRVKDSCLKSLDTLLGFIFGLFRGWLIIILLYILGLMIFPVDLYKQQENSKVLGYVSESFDVLETLLPSEFSDEISQRIDDAEKQVAKKKLEEKNSIVPKPKANQKQGVDKASSTKSGESKKVETEVGYEQPDRDSMDRLIDELDMSEDVGETNEKNKSGKGKGKSEKVSKDSGDDSETAEEDTDDVEYEEDDSNEY